MDREAFIRAARPRWEELGRLLEGRWQQNGSTISRAVSLYRQLCSDLMRAQSLGCGPDVMNHLDALAARAHNGLYQRPAFRIRPLFTLLLVGFPRALRRSGWFFLSAVGLFAVAFVVGLLGSLHSAEFSESVLPVQLLESMANAYQEGFARGRQEGIDAAMAGFYVYNNVGIAFRCFATGILFGIGSAFFLVYNGLVMGTVFGYVSMRGGGINLITFVSGHSAFELTAIVISGAAGLKMGFSLVSTRGLSRLASLRAQAADLVALVSGVAAMLLVAAIIEGFWSPSSVPNGIKWFVGSLNGVAVASFLVFGGRQRRVGARR